MTPRSSVGDTVVPPPVRISRHGDPEPEGITTTSATPRPAAPSTHRRHTRWPMRVVVAASLFGGVAAAAVAVAVSVGGTEPVVNGLVLLGFATGWALLLAFSVFFTDFPQRWAAVPAAVMGVGGAALLFVAPSSAAMDALGWVWPPAVLAMLAWVTTRVRRQLPRRGGRWLLYPVVAVTALAAVGGGYQIVSQAVDRTSVGTARGQLIDVGDHRLYLSCSGSGKPTVILEPGLGETSSAWGWIAPAVARHTRVCVYDRAGRGRSDPSPHAQDGDQISTDLHTLLRRANVTGPLVLVGHSLGGLYVLDYAARYPHQVAGMVEVDGTPSTAFTALPEYPGVYSVLSAVTGLSPGLARLGVTRLMNLFVHAGLPTEAREQARAELSTAGQARSQRDELAMVPTMMARARAVTDLGDIPLYVLTAPVEAPANWLTPQMEIAALSRNSVHLVVAGASHQSLLDNKGNAAVTSQAITHVVDAARSGAPLR